jgi:hypothetical protein
VKIRATIQVREYGGSAIARCNGKSASTTGNREWAIQHVALKAAGVQFSKSGVPAIPFEDCGIKIRNVRANEYVAEWEDLD